jgi:hypothetical protein
MIIKSNFIPLDLYNKFIGNNPEFKDKPISIFNDYIPTIEELNINPYNILIIMEPNQLFGLHNWAIQNHNNFSCILTWGQDVLDKCENALLLPFGTTFLHSNDEYKQMAFNNKKLKTSFMCGSKHLIEGHFLRHKIYNRKLEITTPTKWLFSGDKKLCFKESMFHLTIENSKNQNYFTEKIIDAFITKTIPVYWGCPNIEEFFDIRGMYVFKNENEAIAIINSLTKKDYYSKKEYIEKNYQTAIYYAEYFMRCKDIIREIIKLNNI